MAAVSLFAATVVAVLALSAGLAGWAAVPVLLAACWCGLRLPRRAELLVVGCAALGFVGAATLVVDVHAGLAAHLLPERPDQAAAALGHVRQASGAALDDLAALLGTLREPTPGLAGLDLLLDPADTLAVVGSPRPVPAAGTAPPGPSIMTRRTGAGSSTDERAASVVLPALNHHHSALDGRVGDLMRCG